MPHFICVTCGTQFAATESEPDACPICRDERQYVGHAGQRWTTLDDLRKAQARFMKLAPEVLAQIPAPHLDASVTPAQVDDWSEIMMAQELLKKKADPAKVIWK